MKTKKNKLITFDEHLDSEYGKRGTARREKYEQGFETFKLGIVLQEIRKQKPSKKHGKSGKAGSVRLVTSKPLPTSIQPQTPSLSARIS